MQDQFSTVLTLDYASEHSSKKKDCEVILLPTKYIGLGREKRGRRAKNKERRKQIKK
jgi:hypothetical protein